jgi:hypothetical protein
MIKAASRFFYQMLVLLHIAIPRAQSTFARQVAYWSREKASAKNFWPNLAIVIDEDCTDLKGSITSKLFAVFGEQLEPELLTALLREGRIIPIVDGLSERLPETQLYFATLSEKLVVRQIIYTSRFSIEMVGHDITSVRPQALGSNTLIHLTTVLLDDWRNQQLEHKDGIPQSVSIVDQLHIGTQLAELTASGASDEIPITPLLVKLFVEKAISLYERGQSLSNLPSSIPDIYFDYLKLINPPTPDPGKPRVSNWLSDETMLQIVRVIAVLALGPRLMAGQWISGPSARDALTANNISLPPGCDPLKRLVDNGVLKARSVGAGMFFSFLLDPVAEFAAAYEIATRNGSDAVKWTLLETEIRTLDTLPAGFMAAMEIVTTAYGSLLGWYSSSYFQTGGRKDIV